MYFLPFGRVYFCIQGSFAITANHSNVMQFHLFICVCVFFASGNKFLVILLRSILWGILCVFFSICFMDSVLILSRPQFLVLLISVLEHLGCVQILAIVNSTQCFAIFTYPECKIKIWHIDISILFMIYFN